MNVGKTLIGGVIGAAVAICIHTLLRTQTSMNDSWYPLLTGLFTGLGVRQAHKSLAGNVSYLRGGVAGLLAAAAIFASPYAVTTVYNAQSERMAAGGVKPAPIVKQRPVADAGEADDEGDDDAGAEIAETFMPRGQVGAANREQSDVLPFLFMAGGIFLAYEFARGSAAPKADASDASVATDDSSQGAPAAASHDEPTPTDASPDETDRGKA